MSGIIRQSIAQSDVPPEELSSQCCRRATSLIIRLLSDEAMETIDRLVQDEETNSGVNAMSKKFPTLQSMTEGILFIDGSLFARGAAGPHGQLPVNVSREGLKEYLDFPDSKDSSRVVSASVIEAEFLRRTGHKSLKDAWTTIVRWFNYQNAQPRKEWWFIDDLVFFSSTGREDGKLLSNMCAKLVIRQALKWIGRPSSLYISTTLVSLALAHVDPQSSNLMPDWYTWIFEHISFRLNHKNEDMASTAKFWEGWQGVV
ncbi:hypothetical protein R1flu_024528 [Riccia fluitans]|uniref:Uncharacterized protein n=1 Tax=Riccia fluitans TaxID=41844 RepID=A0ABD1XY73_9MARC